jgi:S1-C subfamily serine protease
LIGMAVYGPRRRVLAIPGTTISRVVQAIKDKGHVARGYLGVSLQPVPLPARDGEPRRRAAMVVTIDPAGIMSRETTDMPLGGVCACCAQREHRSNCRD